MFYSMLGSYNSQKVARFEKGDLFVSTAKVTDSASPYETAVSHPFYNTGRIVIVEQYDTLKEAKIGHKKWVSIMTHPELPAELVDVSTNIFTFLLDVIGDEDWRTFKSNEDI